jgi:hypothetical protein
MGKKCLHRLGFKVTNEFLEKNNFNKYSCGDGLISIITLIKSYAIDILQKEWMASNVLKLPYTLNAINPAALLLKEDGYEDGIVDFCCHASLSKNELDRMSYLLTNSIEDFIEKHRKGLEEYNPTINLENININPKLQGSVDIKFLNENLALVKILFMRELSKRPIFIGTSDDEKYIQEGREIKFYPAYNRQRGHMLISEIIDIDISGKIERMAYTITPNVEAKDGDIYIYPMIGIKRMVNRKRFNSIQYGTANSYSTLVFDGKTYYFPRVAYRENKKTNNKEVQLISEDWRLYTYLEEFKGITFNDIKEHIEGDDKQNIYLTYSNKLGNKHNLNSGVPTCDKLDIYNHIKANMEGLETIAPIQELKMKRPSGGLDNTDKIVLSKTIHRNDITDLELLVLHPPTSTLYEETISVIESEKLIKNNIGLTIDGDGLYSLETSDNKIINLTVKNIPSIVGLEIKADDETVEERLEKLINDMGEKSPHKVTLTLIDLENMGKYDAKAIIRNTLDGHGIINQFIEGNKGINENKIASGLRDLLNDIGLGNLNQAIEENEVVYTLHKANKINFICRIDNNTVEIKVPMITEDYCHVTDIYPVLPFIKDKIKDIENIDSLAIAIFLQDIEQEKRDVIVILENGETQYNTIVKNLDQDIDTIEKIKSHAKEYITTDLLGHQEVIQLKDGKVTLGTGIYKIKDGVYISIGDKGQDKTTTEASKIRRWSNSYGKVSIGATISYKDRIAYEIRIHKNEEADDMCELVHKLRLAMTMHSHLNRCITTDYILGFVKHL